MAIKHIIATIAILLGWSVGLLTGRDNIHIGSGAAWIGLITLLAMAAIS